MEIRIKIAAALLLGVVSLLGTAHAAHARPAEVRYACDDGQQLIVSEAGPSASVRYTGRTYELERKRSSIGRKYLSPTAALIIDGPSAVFVADDLLQLGQCIEVAQTAAAN